MPVMLKVRKKFKKKRYHYLNKKKERGNVFGRTCMRKNKN